MKREELCFFNPLAPLATHGQHKLPHWQQTSATYFVTFRLGDSLPQSLLKRWHQDRDDWLRKHPEPWTDEVENEYHKRFSQQLEEWLDAGHGSCCLAHPEYRALLAETLNHQQGKDYLLHNWVIMPNHVHLVFSLRKGVTLEKTVAAWKSVSARRLNAHLGHKGSLWQENNFDRLIRNERHFARCVDYIRENPVKAGLESPRFHLWESDLAKGFA